MIADEHKIPYQKQFTFVHFLEINLGGEGDTKKIFRAMQKTTLNLLGVALNIYLHGYLGVS